ncbi:PQQ-dependent sugar dehydrogenase [Caldimonas sp. KR1-144]|uniref:PQQ-dependent sugar dehydrogenase n=1 Tax=Caldimonas sp. KR1-144 TaxID=3400911 RepID=UPI003C047387
MRKRFVWAAVAIALPIALLGALLGATLAGALLFAHDVAPIPRAVAATKKVYERLRPRDSGTAELTTTLLKLQIERTLTVPPARRGVGGGLTSFGRELVVIDNDGTIYVESDGQVARSGIAGPDNGYAAYEAAAQRLGSQGYTFNLARLRYNDILSFETTQAKYLLASYIEWNDAGACVRNAVARLTLPAATASLRDVKAQSADWQVIARTEPCIPIKKQFRAVEGHMSGGRMARFGPNSIAITSGDFHIDGVYGPVNVDPASDVALAQDPKAEYGKVLEIDVESGRKRIISSGNRNMQGIATAADGTLWTIEHGPRGGDELNRQREGANYGWPLQTFGTQYSAMPWPGALPYGRHDRFEAPAYVWVPSAAVSGLTAVRGFDPAWDGDLIASSLVAESLYRLRISEGRAVYAEPIRIGTRMRAVHQHTDGRLVVWTDEAKLLYLKPKAASMTFEFAQRAIEQSTAPAQHKAATKAALTMCIECHSLDDGNHEKAPSLAGVWNRRIGSTAYAGHSSALSGKGGRWDRASLEAFLTNPQTFAPGTKMPDPGLADPAVRAELVNVFEKIATTPE